MPAGNGELWEGTELGSDRVRHKLEKQSGSLAQSQGHWHSREALLPSSQAPSDPIRSTPRVHPQASAGPCFHSSPPTTPQGKVHPNHPQGWLCCRPGPRLSSLIWPVLSPGSGRACLHTFLFLEHSPCYPGLPWVTVRGGSLPAESLGTWGCLVLLRINSRRLWGARHLPILRFVSPLQQIISRLVPLFLPWG